MELRMVSEQRFFLSFGSSLVTNVRFSLVITVGASWIYLDVFKELWNVVRYGVSTDGAKIYAI